MSAETSAKTSSAEIFRKVALERLSTPDQLDQALLLTPSAIRPVLYFAALVVLAIVVASVLISVPITASGIGIVLQAQGMAEVMAPGSGRVIALQVDLGQTVTKGQLLATLAQPDLENGLQTVRAELKDLQDQRARITRIQQTDHALQTQQILQQRRELSTRLASGKLRRAWLTQRVEQDLALRSAGYLSQNRLRETEAELLQINDLIGQTESQLQALAGTLASARHAHERETIDLTVRIATLEHRRDELAQRLSRETRLISDQDGVVSEMKIAVGDVLASGQPVIGLLPAALHGPALVQSPGSAPNPGTAKSTTSATPTTPTNPSVSRLQVIAYLPAGEAKKVRPGMEIRVTPDNVKKEEFGSIMGQVLSVAPIPATFEGMQRTLRNRQLVQNLSQNGAPIELRLALSADPGRPSGLRWTSRGPNHRLETGTTVQAEVVVKRMRLLTLALPALESWLHLEPQA